MRAVKLSGKYSLLKKPAPVRGLFFDLLLPAAGLRVMSIADIIHLP
jgi:hypothetical protein